MKNRYYVDTSIWIDLHDDRVGFGGGRLGDYAYDLFMKIKFDSDEIAISDILLLELEKFLSDEEIKGMFVLFDLYKVVSDDGQRLEAERISEDRGVPKGDVLHAILSRDHRFILVARDKHFRLITDICPHFSPEDIA